MSKQYFKVTKITKEEYYELTGTSEAYWERKTLKESRKLDNKTWLGYTFDDELTIDLED